MSKKMTEEQEAELQRFERSWRKYDEARRTALERAKIAAEAEVALLRADAARDAHRALGVGVSKRRIGVNVMKTTDYGTIQKLLDTVSVSLHFEDESVVTPAQSAQAQNLTVEPLGNDRYRVTLAGAELEQARAWANWDAQKPTPPQYVSAEFKRHDTGAWEPVTEGWLAEIGEEHPVVVYVAKDAGRAKLAELWEGLR